MGSGERSFRLRHSLLFVEGDKEGRVGVGKVLDCTVPRTDLPGGQGVPQPELPTEEFLRLARMRLLWYPCCALTQTGSNPWKA